MSEELNNQPAEQEAGKTYTAEELQAELTRVGTKEARKTEQALLRQLGLKSKDDIPTLLEKLNSMQEKPADKQDTTPAVTPEQYQQLLDRLNAVEASDKQAKAELSERRQAEYLRDAKIPEEQIDYYQFKINKLVKDDVTFEDAAAQFIKENPPQIKPPEFATGSGKPMATHTEKEKILADFKEAQKNKDHAGMSRITRMAHLKGVQLY